MSSEQEEAPSTVQVKLLDREYQVSCPPSEQEALLKSARHLDENMRRIKSRGNIHGLDKIAVMAALNITHELLQKNRVLNQHRHETAQQVKYLEDKIDRALHDSRQIEL
ncbi:MAG: cell division protein ZapA [Pseudohongiellaceae bacterium]